MEPILDIENATVVRGERVALDRLALRIEDGQHSAILGRNGSGKSTLVQLIERQLYPLAGGRVRIFGRGTWNVFELRNRLGIVSPARQSDFTNGQLERLEVFEAVASGFFAARGLWHQRLTEEMREASRAALDRICASHLIGRTMETLSTGEARRVLIARALVHRPHALLLDEPCSGLDPATRHEFLESLREIARGGTTLLLVTHHIEEILPEIGHVAMLQDGRLLEAGAKADLIVDAKLKALFGTKVRVEQHDGWYWPRFG